MRNDASARQRRTTNRPTNGRRPRARTRGAIGSLPALVAAILVARTAEAAPPYVDRGITLPRHDWAFNFGLGLAHGYPPSRVGPGLNAEMAVGLTGDLELGVRGGIRMGDNARGLRAGRTTSASPPS